MQMGILLQHFYIGLVLEDYYGFHSEKRASKKITLKDTATFLKKPMIINFLVITALMNGAFLSAIMAEITNIAYESGIEPHIAATILV